MRVGRALRRAVAWLQADWGAIDDPMFVGVVVLNACLLTFGGLLLLFYGALIALVILPVAALAWCRAIRAIRHRGH